MEKFCLLFCAHQWPINCLFIIHTPGQLPPHDTGHGVKAVTLGGVETLTSTLGSEFMTQSLALSIDVCQGLGISPLRASFSQADVYVGPTSAPDLLFSGFSKSLELFFF